VDRITAPLFLGSLAATAAYLFTAGIVGLVPSVCAALAAFAVGSTVVFRVL
jgi:hypothetical protein